MRLVVIESPFAGRGRWWWQRWLDRRANLRYARAAMANSLHLGEAPIASHLLYTQMLNDNIPRERMLGINAGLAWGAKSELTAVYVDRGVTRGMQMGIARAKAEDRPIEYRRLR